MNWDRARSEARIRHSLQSVPSNLVQVQTYDQRQKSLSSLQTGRGTLLPANPLIQIPPSMAVLVDGVHVYVQLTKYHSVLQDAQRQTEARHRRALQFLHTHYSACDRIIAEYQVQRVDFHGSRLHAVIATPSGPEFEKLRVEKAVRFANAIARMVEISGQTVLNGEFETDTRIGIDTGNAIAVNSGRGSEPEPLFLGSPANYAAKLADGDEPGIFLSDRARTVLSLPKAGSRFNERLKMFDIREVGTFSGDPAIGVTDARLRSLSANLKVDIEPALRDANFVFHRHTPPLRTIDYQALSPSKSIHMPLASIFADIDGFTKYVDDCMATNRVPELISNLHAIRLELAAVLKNDFDGRKVRFIGDCLHGLLADGTAYETDERETVRHAVMCAAAMRSSFNLCKHLLPGVWQLGLAIGVELGPTPITRLGIRGDLSIRCATSKAVSDSEDLQSDCDGSQIAIGERAFAAAPTAMRRRFDEQNQIRDLDYATAVEVFSESNLAAPNLGTTTAGTSTVWLSRAEASNRSVHNEGGNRHA